MSNFTITIVGTGVIGTSLALALKQTEDPPRLIGHDKDVSIASKAAKLGAFDKADWNLINACEPADLIILAMPLNGVRFTLEAIGPYLKPNAVVTDTCVSKQAVLAWATELLPEHVHFVGGNPIVQTTGVGSENARADLFKGRRYCLTPASSAHEDAVQLLTGLVSLLGAEPFFLDPAEHDGLITAVEHLPAALSVALVRALSQQKPWRETQKLAGGSFERTSAAASGDPDGLAEAFAQNRPVLLHWLDQYLAELQNLRALLAAESDSNEALAQHIDAAVVARLNWLKEYQTGGFIDPELVSQKVEIPGFFERLIGFGGRRKRQGDDK